MTTDAEIITFRYLPVLLVRERDVARRVGAPLCLPTRQAGHMAKRRVGVEYSPSMLEPVRPGAVSPDRALCLPTFSHFVIVNKTSLSLPPHILFINTQLVLLILFINIQSCTIFTLLS